MTEVKKTTENGSNASPEVSKIKRSTLVTIIIDILLIASMTLVLFVYIYRNNNKTYNQNIENITNIAMAKSTLIKSLLDNSSENLKQAQKYCSGKDVSEVLDYLSYTTMQDDEYQLLKYDSSTSADLYYCYTGYSTRTEDGNYIGVEYNDTSLSDSLYFSDNTDEIKFSQSFTNPTNGFRYYSAFCKLTLTENNSETEYYLVKLQQGNDIIKQLKMYSQYENLTTAICNRNGKYLACDSGFKSDNFFDYIYEYNKISVDEKNSLKSSVQNDEDGTGTLTYNDFKGQKSTFVYVECNNTADWYIIVSLPQSGFVSSEIITLFPLIIILFLVVLLVFNAIRLLQIVSLLKLSVERERISNASKSSFLSRMSHEIRTPLNAVMGYVSIAQKNHDNVEKVDDCIAKTEISAKHLLSVINDILDISAIESGKIKIVNDNFNFKSLINAITVMFYTLANEKKVKFDVIFETFVDESVIGDQMRINQILINLLNNAIKFTPSGGNVALRIRQENIDPNTCKIKFAVIDTGIGISEEQMKKIWEPFEQADNTISRKFGGSGLGLTITKTLIDMMHGTLELQSELGKGSTFTVTIDLQRVEQQYTNRSYDFSQINALVVDDEVAACEYAGNLLEHYRVKYKTAYSGNDAIKMIESAYASENPFNLCLLDMRLNDINGIETAKIIREKYGNDLPVIILSAYDFTEYLDEAKNLGINKFLSKPLFKSTLFDLLVSLNADKTPNADNIYSTPSTPVDYDFKGTKILLAEDNQMNMEIAIDILSFANLSVEQAWNGEEVVEKFLNSPPGYYKAILMDVQMPVLDGYSATQKIRASSHPEAMSIPIIAMTANAFEHDIHASIDAGMNDHVSKPIDENRLYGILKKYGV